MFKLVIQDDEGKTTVVPLIRDEITIGRKEGNTIRLTERNVSRRHARIMRNNGEVHIEDLGSYNGIRVNNARIAERVSLRVSDQVQIGDYKLYLKAEGVEQVDDARTMPIERVDANGEATTQPNGNGTPTVPLATPIAASGLAGAQLVGAPNRTMVAIADTDPAGRPVATAAAVAALTAPVGYGRLVVLSSNFAGKEFELSRPQMIIGRTDENDIVVNHRSISRNHAKLVREPETGRYTISDLQSSNGVRVNGQDYSKVELRRGDVVDLGHVRLRFIEPGEDFVFARDAVITDVPESGGGKKGLLVAILLAVVVLGGVGVFVLTRGGDETKKPQGSNEVVTPGSGTGAENGTGTGSDNIVVVENGTPTVEDASVAVAPTNPNPNTNPTVNTEEISLKCTKLRADRKWSELVTCGDELSAADPAKGKEFHDVGIAENKAESAVRNLNDAAKKGDLEAAKRFAKAVPEGSVYRRESEGFLDNAKETWAEAQHKKAKAAIERCKDYNRIVSQTRAETGTDYEWMKVPCKDTGTVAVKNPNEGSGSNTTKVTPPIKDPPDKPDGACDADALKKKGDDYLGNGMDTAALAQFEASLRCKYNSGVVKTAFLAACRSKQAAKAKLYFAKLPPELTSNYSQICLRFGITVP